MISITRIWAPLGRFFEATAKARVNSVLLGMDREKLEKMGYSYELLRRGPAAWPWREMTQNSAPTAEFLTPAGAHESESEQVIGSRENSFNRPGEPDHRVADIDPARDAA